MFCIFYCFKLTLQLPLIELSLLFRSLFSAFLSLISYVYTLSCNEAGSLFLRSFVKCRASGNEL